MRRPEVSSPDSHDTTVDRVRRGLALYVHHVVPPRGLPADTIDGKGDEYWKAYSCTPPPLFIILISLVELVVFICYGVELGGITASGPVPVDSPLIYDPYLRYQAWRYITYIFIHVGYVHITNNLIMQVAVGIPLEMVHGWWRVAIIYFCGLLAGSLGTSIFDPTTYLAGASGAIYAIMIAHIATIILNWSEMKFALLELIAIIIVIVTDVSVAVCNRYSDAGNPIHCAYVAHLSGAVAGLLVGIGVLRNLKVRPWEKKLWLVSIIIYAVFIFVAIVWNAFFPDYFLPSH